MGNIVGSSNFNFSSFFSGSEGIYILGLWCADSYWWSSSIGISNTDGRIIGRCRDYFLRFFPKERIKFRDNHLYVNSRPLLREFRSAKSSIEDKLTKSKLIYPYFAGRFDGDGSVNNNLRNDCRIVYGYRKEAELDRRIMKKIGIQKTQIYFYQSANTYCLYVSRYQSREFLEAIYPYSTKLQSIKF